MKAVVEWMRTVDANGCNSVVMLWGVMRGKRWWMLMKVAMAWGQW